MHGYGLWRALSQLAIALKYDDLPEDVILYTKRLLLDTLGCGLAGYLSEPSRITLRLVREFGGRAESTLYRLRGEGSLLPCRTGQWGHGALP